jgi:hypothetical protein
MPSTRCGNCFCLDTFFTDNSSILNDFKSALDKLSHHRMPQISLFERGSATRVSAVRGVRYLVLLGVGLVVVDGIKVYP